MIQYVVKTFKGCGFVWCHKNDKVLQHPYQCLECDFRKIFFTSKFSIFFFAIWPNHRIDIGIAICGKLIIPNHLD
jgi:hypothetical protein